MKFHPVISIVLGVTASFVLYLIALSLIGYGWVNGFLTIFSYIIGGFIAVFYARKKKIQYALYEGIILILILEFLTNFIVSSDVFVYFVYSISIFLLAMIGGMIGLMIDKNYSGFNPYISVLAGSFIGTACIGITSILGYNPDSLHLGMINIIGGIVSFMIGGFLSTILAKEKNVLDGFFTGVILLIIIAIPMQLLFYMPIIIHILGFIIYFVSAVIGGYLAIITAKHQKLISNG